MDKRSKILLGILVVATLASIGYTFYKTVIKQDFELLNTQSSTDSQPVDATRN
jgi:hypothetical protein